MLLEETKETFSYLIKKCESLGLAYVQLVRYVSFMDESFDGKGRATQHDVWGTYSPLLKNTKIFVNGDIDAQEGEKLVKDGKVHAVVQGRPYIHVSTCSSPRGTEEEEGLLIPSLATLFGLFGMEQNPDFTKRALTGTPLNPDSDPKTW